MNSKGMSENHQLYIYPFRSGIINNSIKTVIKQNIKET